jgi:rRNA maturation endonuclease Nob1
MATRDHVVRTQSELRSAIERELQERLLARSSPAARLRCLACNQLNPIDARFCTGCGARFNAAVVHRGSTASPAGH